MAVGELRARAAGDPALAAVVGLTALGVALRLVGLGTRVAHFDEARVAWWTLEFLRTGEFHYRFIIHGPFLQHANRVVFGLLGPSDFAMRLVPALVGGLLPLAALLFRDRLRDVEVAALALFLAVDPVLVYYSRFSRSTVLVAGFAFVAFGLFVRAVDTRRARYAHAGVAFLALGFAAKENAVVYVACWLGAAALLVDHRLFSPLSGESGTDRLRALLGDVGPDRGEVRGPALSALGHLALAVALFLAVSVFFYAPRAGGGGGVGLWQVVGAPGRAPAVLEATLADVTEGYSYWLGGPGREATDGNLLDKYASTLGRFVEVLGAFAAALVGLAVAGFVAERYAADRPRDLVMFASYWGFVSVLGYPLGTDIWGAWIAVNALVPLAVPAAVGLGLVLRWGHGAFLADDRVGVGLAAVLLVLVAGQVAVAGVGGVYRNPAGADNQLVQFAQPGQGMRGSTGAIAAVAPANEGPDVLVVGDYYVDGDEQAVRTPACVHWFHALPYPWYFAAHGAEVACATDAAGVEDPPPVVVARARDRAELAGRLDGYTVTSFRLRTTAVDTVVFVDADRVPDR